MSLRLFAPFAALLLLNTVVVVVVAAEVAATVCLVCTFMVMMMTLIGIGVVVEEVFGYTGTTSKRGKEEEKRNSLHNWTHLRSINSIWGKLNAVAGTSKTNFRKRRERYIDPMRRNNLPPTWAGVDLGLLGNYCTVAVWTE